MLDAVAGGAEIVQENDVRNIQFLDESFCVNDPRKVRGSHRSIDHRTGNAKSRGGDAFIPKMIGRLAGELLDDAFELRELLAGKALLEDGRERAAFLREKRKVALRPANITRQDQAAPPEDSLNRFNEPIIASMGCTTAGRHVRAEARIREAPNCRPHIVAR